MSNVCFFSFREDNREQVLTIKGRAVNSNYPSLDFRVKDLLKRWNTEDSSTIRQAITKAMDGTSRTIVFVGNDTHKSYWVPQEVSKTLEEGKKLYAIRLKDTNGKKPKCLEDNSVYLYSWSESTLQDLATR